MVVGLALAATSVCAQSTTKQDSERGGTPVPRVTRNQAPKDAETGKTEAPAKIGVYHLQSSRALFRACDLDANDRILPLEALKALKNFDRKDFRAFDTNSDGRIEFDEFDTRFREITRYGGEIAVNEIARRRLPARLGAASGYPRVLITWFANLDSDANDKLGRNEFEPLAKLLKPDSFQQLDKNLDDGLSIDEMRSLVEFITMIEERSPRRGATQRPLPIDFRSADLDGDHRLDQSELERALYRIDPNLPAHARAFLQGADQNADLFLDRFEIEEAQARERRAALEAIPKNLEGMNPESLRKLLEKLDGKKGNLDPKKLDGRR